MCMILIVAVKWMEVGSYCLPRWWLCTISVCSAFPRVPAQLPAHSQSVPTNAAGRDWSAQIHQGPPRNNSTHLFNRHQTAAWSVMRAPSFDPPIQGCTLLSLTICLHSLPAWSEMRLLAAFLPHCLGFWGSFCTMGSVTTKHLIPVMSAGSVSWGWCGLPELAHPYCSLPCRDCSAASRCPRPPADSCSRHCPTSQTLNICALDGGRSKTCLSFAAIKCLFQCWSWLVLT